MAAKAKTRLLVIGEEGFARSVRRWLPTAHFALTRAAKPEMAAGEAADVALLDWCGTTVKTLAALASLRGRLPKVSVIVAIAEKAGTAREAVLRNGADEFVVKDRDAGAALRHALASAAARRTHRARQAAPPGDEEIFRVAFEAAGDAMLVTDARTGTILAANRGAEALLRLPRDQIVGRNQVDLHPPEDVVRYRELFRRHARAGGARADMAVIQRADGSRIEVEIAAGTTHFGGRPVLVGVFRERGAARRAGEERRSDGMFGAAVIDTMAALVLVLDREGRVVRFNRACERTTGFAAAEVVGKAVWDLLLPADELARGQAEFERLLGGGVPERFEINWRTRDGGRRLIAWRNTVLPDAAGQATYVVCTGIDVTEQRRVEAALKESQRLLRAVVDTVPAVINAKDPQSRYVLINRYQAEAYGTTTQDAIGRTAGDLLGAGYGAYTAERDRGVVLTGRPLAPYEETYADASGRNRCWLTNKVPLKDEEGNVRYVVTVSLDISERKQAEAALAKAHDELEVRIAERTRQLEEQIEERKRTEMALIESEQRFRDMAEAESDWLWEMGPDLRFSHFSDSIREILGVDPRALVGKRREESRADDEDPEKWRRHLDDLANRRPFRDFQYRIVRPDGTPQYIKISGKPIFAEDGTFLGYRGAGTNVTARVEAEKQAEKARQILTDAIESISEGFVLYDADDRLVLYNSRYSEMHPRLALYIKPGIRFENLVRRAVEVGEIEGIEGNEEEWVQARLAFHRNGGTHEQHVSNGRWILINERRTRDGGVVSVRTDITDLRLAEICLKQSERRFRDIVEAASDWFWEMGPDLRFTYVSERGSETTLAPAEQVLGRTRQELADPNDVAANPEKWRRHLADMEERRPFRNFEYKVVTESGERRIIMVSGVPFFDERGAFTGYRGAARDVTDRRRAEEELRAAKERAEFASRTKSEFLASMSHELRTPLNAIIGFSDVMMSEVFGPVGNPKYKEYILNIKESGSHLLDLISDILDLSKIEAGKFDLYEEDVDISRAVEDSVRLVRGRADANRVRILAAIDDGLPPLRADGRRVKQILLNLLSNAVKFTPVGGQVTVAACLTDGGDMALTVADTGIGMEEYEIPLALSPFGQVGDPHTRRQEGTGLGLYVTSLLVESHGGALKVESRKGIGTTVTVNFPAARVLRVG